MLVLHVLAGSIALLAGFAALFAPKGGPLHRGAGTAFALAMLAMTASGGGMAVFDTEAGSRISVVAAALAFGLVASGWATVRPPAQAARAVAVGLALMAGTTASAALAMAALAAAGGGRFDGMPMPMYLVFGGIAALAAVGDARLLAGRRLDGRQRLARHLWRMGVALLIATMSFFLGQADEFPAWLRGPATTAGPPLLVFGAVLVHFVRMRWRRAASRAPAVA